MTMRKYHLVILFFLAISNSISAPPENTKAIFVQNRGQILDNDGNLRPDIAFTAEMSGMKLFFTPNGVSYVFVKTENPKLSQNLSLTASHPVLSQKKIAVFRVDMRLLGANPNPKIVAEGISDEYCNYYFAHCPDGITNVPLSRKIVYESIYPNIDLVYYSNFNGLKYDFVVKAGGNPSDIKFDYVGAESVRLTDEGKILASTSLGNLEEESPLTYQTADGKQVIIPSRYELKNGIVSFAVAKFDLVQNLTIDPQVVWATFVGGTGDESYCGLARDSSNNILFAGGTTSVNFPVSVGAWQSKISGNSDLFVMKISDDGTKKIWSTYYGGTGIDDGGYLYGTVATDRSKNILVGGLTQSANFPTSAGAFQAKNAGKSDMVIVKFDSTGKRVWATYYGGKLEDACDFISTDNKNNVLLAGYSHSVDFPVSAGAFQKTYPGAFSQNPVIVKLDSNGKQLISTYFGGTSAFSEWANEIAADAKGDIVVVGRAASYNFPTTSGAFKETSDGSNSDYFIAKFSATGSLLWSTLYGGDSDDTGNSFCFDAQGNIIVVGSTQSANFPIATDAIQKNLAGTTSESDIGIVMFDSTGKRLWASYFGGNHRDAGAKVRVDKTGNTWITGSTNSTDFPVTLDALQTQLNGNSDDGFILELDKSHQKIWSSYHGGSGTEYANSLEIDADNMPLMGGVTTSPDLNSTPNTIQPKFGNGFSDGFLLKLNGCSFTPTIKTTGIVKICPGDSVILEASNGSYVSYVWSNGSQSRAITVKDSGSYFVTVRDEKGCMGTSLPTRVQFNIPPSPKIIADSPTEFCTGDSTTLDAGIFSSYLWSTGETTPKITAKKFGNYKVTVQDASGCKGASDVITLTQKKATIVGLRADTTIGMPGNMVQIPIRILLPTDVNIVQAQTLQIQFEIRFDKYLIEPLSVSRGKIESVRTEGNEKVVTLSVFALGDSILTIIKGQALLSAYKTTTDIHIHLLAVNSIGSVLCVSASDNGNVNGTFSIAGYCYGYNLRPISALSMTVAPNPASSESFEIQIHSVESGEHTLTMFDAYGRVIFDKKWMKASGDAEDIVLSQKIGEQSEGVYFLVARSSQFTTTARVMIMR